MTKKQAIERAKQMGGGYIYYSPVRGWVAVSFRDTKPYTVIDMERSGVLFVTRDGLVF